MRKVVRTSGTLGRRDERSRLPLCVETSVDLANRARWTPIQPGVFSAVRLNFVADVGHVKRPRAFIHTPNAALRPGAKRIVSPVGQIDLAKTCKPLVDNVMLTALHQVVREMGGRRARAYDEINDAIREVVVPGALRPGVATSEFKVVRGSPGKKISLRGRGDNAETVLLGVREVTLYLAYVDYLVVIYKQKNLGRHLIRNKTPLIKPDAQARLNELDMGGFPFATFHVLEAHSAGASDEHYAEVAEGDLNTLTLQNVPAARATALQEVSGRVASLYHVANAAFPMNREAALQRHWTEETLNGLPLGPDYKRVRVRDIDWD